MILTIDIGNTQLTGGVFEDENLIFQFRKSTSASATSDENGIFLRSVLRENGIDWKKISKIGVCSVVPSANYSIASAFSKYFSKEALFIQAGIKTGLKLKYPNPKEIGADRIAGALGASSLFPSTNAIIIDLGTAITVDNLTSQKEYLGGCIFPGLKMGMESLASGTAKLPSVEITKPSKICGTSTTEAIQSGLYYGTAGAIKELCYLYQKKVFNGEKPFIIGTGGFSRIFEEYHIFDKIVPHLVLLGVKKALEMN